jgi:hypothetical protein
MNEMNNLLKEWKDFILLESDHFVEDGVISHEHWESTPHKILFILKETNGYEGNITPLINKAITLNPKSKLWARPTFHNIGRWAYGLQNLPESVENYNQAHKSRKSSLLSCAFINIKKTSGERTAGKEVEYHATKYASLIRKQIDILSPKIIVFGGTYQIMKNHVMPEMAKISPRIHQYKDTICINANHPACTLKRTTIYDQVVLNYSNYLTHKD